MHANASQPLVPDFCQTFNPVKRQKESGPFSPFLSHPFPLHLNQPPASNPPPLFPNPQSVPHFPSNLSSSTHSSTSLLAPSSSPSLSNAATSIFSGESMPGALSSMRTARTHSSTL